MLNKNNSITGSDVAERTGPEIDSSPTGKTLVGNERTASVSKLSWRQECFGRIPSVRSFWTRPVFAAVRGRTGDVERRALDDRNALAAKPRVAVARTKTMHADMCDRLVGTRPKFAFA